MESSETGSQHYEVLSSQDLNNQEIFSYHELGNHRSENTIYIDPRGLGINGRHLMVTQDEDGNGMTVVVVDHENLQTIDQMLTVHPLNYTSTNSLNEHETFMTDETSQSVGFIQTEEVYQSQDVDNIINIENSVQTNDNNFEMDFIPNSMVINSDLMVNKEMEQGNLMQLASFAFNVQADSNDSIQTDDIKSSLSCIKSVSSVRVTQNEKVEQATDHTLSTTESIIHTTPSSELQGILENKVIHDVPSDISYVQYFRPSSHTDVMPSNNIPDDKSSMALYNTLNQCVTDQKEEIDVSKDSKSLLDEESVFMEHVQPIGIETHMEESVLDYSVENSTIDVVMEACQKLDVNASSIENNSVKDDIDDNCHKVNHINDDLKQERSDIFKESEIPIINQRVCPKTKSVSVQTNSEHECTENNSLSRNIHSSRVWKTGSSFSSRYCSFKSIDKTVFSKVDKNIEEISQSEMIKSNKIDQNIVVAKGGESDNHETPDFQQHPSNDNLNIDLNSSADVEPEKHINCGVLFSVEDEVKPPKYTCIRRKRPTPNTAENTHNKIELFSEFDKDIKKAKHSLSIEKQREKDLNIKASGDISSSDVQTRVYSANKKKILPEKKRKHRTLKIHSCTTKSPNKIVSEETLDTNIKKKNSDNLHSGDDLLSTSFHAPPSTNIQNETPGTSQTSFTSLHISKQKCRQLQSKKDFDKLLQSLSGKSECQNFTGIGIVSEKSKIDQSTCQFSKSVKTRGNSVVKHPNKISKSTKKTSKSYTDCVKAASIVYLTAEEKEPLKKPRDDGLFCSHCNFVSYLVNNYIQHLKYCPHRNP